MSMGEAHKHKPRGPSSNLNETSGWDWMPFHFLYFLFYIFCRRQQQTTPSVKDPKMLAWNALSFFLGWPIAAFLLFIDHFLPFRVALGQAWRSAQLPGTAENASLYAFATLLIISTIVVTNVIFRKKYSWIMHKFAPYDRSPHTITPGMITLPAWCAFTALALLSRQIPIKANLYIWTILIIVEIIFRLWWHAWLRKNTMQQ